ncbi:CC/Se motif family (seleno)protein [Tepidibacillus marianensis]|uniref:CC/Se motif family (seleno)protein n=1 Tax=Tepidibacillus marianensis TaxID=3131995 RepID=UPI0030CADD3E
MKPIVPIFDIEIDLTERVKEYIRDRGGILTLAEAPQTGCCTNLIFVGAAIGKPKEEGYYRVMEYEGVTIYWDPFILKKNKKYELELEGFFKWKTIVVH